MRKLEVLAVESGEYFTSPYTSGSTVDVTVSDGREVVKIEGILIFDESEFTLDDFDTALSLAREGEEGYTIVEAV